MGSNVPRRHHRLHLLGKARFAGFAHHAKLPRAVAVGRLERASADLQRSVHVSGLRRHSLCCCCLSCPAALCRHSRCSSCARTLMKNQKSIVITAPMEVVHTHKVSQTMVGRRYRPVQHRPAGSVPGRAPWPWKAVLPRRVCWRAGGSSNVASPGCLVFTATSSSSLRTRFKLELRYPIERRGGSLRSRILFLF